jgi:hypothetical protein
MDDLYGLDKLTPNVILTATLFNSRRVSAAFRCQPECAATSTGRPHPKGMTPLRHRDGRPRHPAGITPADRLLGRRPAADGVGLLRGLELVHGGLDELARDPRAFAKVGA